MGIHEKLVRLLIIINTQNIEIFLAALPQTVDFSHGLPLSIKNENLASHTAKILKYHIVITNILNMPLREHLIRRL